MNHTTLDETSRLIEKRASGYDINGQEIVAAPYLNINWMKGAGAAIGTIDDVYQLNRAIKNQKLLRKETWQQVFEPTTAGYGLGCTVSRWHGKKRYTHNGGYYSFRTLHIQLPEDDFDSILLSNMGFGNARMAFSEAIYQIFYQNYNKAGTQLAMDPGFAIGGELAYGIMNPQRPSEFNIDNGQEYIGIYESKISYAQVTYHSGEWEIVLNGYRHLPIYPYGKDAFFHKRINESYKFTLNESGELELMGMKKVQ
jgi:hypothetical protein